MMENIEVQFDLFDGLTVKEMAETLELLDRLYRALGGEDSLEQPLTILRSHYGSPWDITVSGLKGVADFSVRLFKAAVNIFPDYQRALGDRAVREAEARNLDADARRKDGETRAFEEDKRLEVLEKFREICDKAESDGLINPRSREMVERRLMGAFDMYVDGLQEKSIQRARTPDEPTMQLGG